ncbi:hypothetical protein P6709_02055 [Jeotgalibacillus sp. ET6]|uniref:hypothetical protein n=1 Tax=Jeotgalibacillus sp. ET6 TaxID=3037260 RepID=UPI002418334B|nr:hypothetical protein [Jeotgalibacillus sp. ET6]MDG5470514.1 hypothetical protein [Jeotgalibacillus sp. ET6]
MQIEQLQQLYTQKMKERNHSKRLNAIDEYLSSQHDLDITGNLTSQQYLLQIIQLINDNPENGEEIISDILLILNDRYSLGEPYLFTQLTTDLTVSELHELLTEVFNGTKSYDSFDFEILETPVADEIGQNVKIRIRYTDWYINNFTQERERELSSGTIEMSYLLKEKICISSKSGYNKLYSKLVEFIEENIEGLNSKHVYIQNKAKSFKDSEFSKLTLLALHLIYKKFSEIGFKVQSVSSITFNNEKAPFVKNAKLGGSNLFKDGDVIERIYRGDKITKFSVSLYKLNKQVENADNAIVVNLTVDFKSILKLTFADNDMDESLLLQVAVDIYQAINASITNINTINEAEILLKENLQNVTTSGVLLTKFLSTVKEDLNALIEDADTLGIITRYFDDKYDIK